MMRTVSTFGSALALVLGAAGPRGCAPTPLFAFQMMFPPKDRIRMGQLDDLEEECREATHASDANGGEQAGAVFCWESQVEREHELANSVFGILARTDAGGSARDVWLPRCLNRQGEVERLCGAINRNSRRLGRAEASALHWPDAPATCVRIRWRGGPEVDPRHLYRPEPESAVQRSLQDTRDYVNEKLSRHGLCPFTKSTERAAIGLEHKGIREGPVVIRHASHLPGLAKTTTNAAVACAMYWQGVADMLSTDEADAATYLLVPPSAYDSDFAEFCAVCDDLIEKSVVLLDGLVGRVWFHPLYSLEEVGKSTGGHTVPLGVARSYMDEYLLKHPGAEPPSEEELARGHDLTRRTPHATINLLRGDQIKKAEDSAGRFAVYAKNILTMLRLEKEETSVFVE
jgi:hypothetical protein